MPHPVPVPALPPQGDLEEQVKRALAEDIGTGDVTAALIVDNPIVKARLITRGDGILCGKPWANEVFRQIDTKVQLDWKAEDGDRVEAEQTLLLLEGPAQSILTGERTAMNFLQLLSGTATTCGEYARLVRDTDVRLLDTRKTLPGLRLAQKYAVACGGCYNHRIGLFDAFLIKENHIAACGGIAQAVTQARANHPDILVEVEVETQEELKQALATDCERIMLDNFSIKGLRDAVEIARSIRADVELEASGNVTPTTLAGIARTGVDYISIGALTKNLKALDLSMRLI
ncbi:MAG: nicotinate-nucleotide diphosphorylase (carboxylating) [Gammaproteobacteria bacterium]|nr:MAG: nicotinate-nucleotide diphosphorylase (carboxylating) [Gammaproteobacteria bacterium]PIE36785.1 MAG: nicotinate-nucleotide diphosphorylase (carboxylating) [Gammaproteobacteria bacterium]